MKMNLFDLSGKTVLITGGAGHLGTAMSEVLAAYDAELFIASRDKEKCENLADRLNQKYGGNCHGITIDISSEKSVSCCVNEILNYGRKIDVVINNAAYSVTGFFETLTEEEWKRAIDGTINGVFRVCSAVIPHMVKAGQGNIINIASMYGLVSPDPNLYQGEVRFNNPACYGAGKAAVLQLTKYIAGYYGEKGIRCNSITPGPFPSKTVQKTQWFVDHLAEKTMLKRIGQPEDLAGTVLLLASDCSSYITGSNICVDGGWTAW